ncbi:MAG TPA: bifunctional DNA primase/polymerase [Casimicrobiaceae bacterium]
MAAVDEIDDWFWRWSHANVAIVTGSLSRLVVLDIDPGHGGAESPAELEELHGPLPRTIEASTGSGGRHVYFRHPAREPLQPISCRRSMRCVPKSTML